VLLLLLRVPGAGQLASSCGALMSASAVTSTIKPPDSSMQIVSNALSRLAGNANYGSDAAAYEGGLFELQGLGKV
jgi:hypothetical protein